jgi:hypothetical protein
MKKILFTLIIFFLTIEIISQNLKKIEKQNVVFVLLNHKDKLSGYGCSKKDPFNFFYCSYSFFKKNGESFEYNFKYTEYPDANKRLNDIDKNMLFRIHKSFIRKNKDIIITREFMEKMGKRVMLDLLYSDKINKTIFIINTAETKNGKITLREVVINYVAKE